MLLKTGFDNLVMVFIINPLHAEFIKKKTYA